MIRLLFRRLQHPKPSKKGTTDEDLRKERLWRNISARAGIGGENNSFTFPRRSYPIFSIIAVFSVIFLCWILIHNMQRRSAISLAYLSSGHYTIIQTSTDGRLQISDSCGHAADPFEVTLPDGTNVWLCYGSRLTYDAVFNGPERKVFLDGQASFRVAAGNHRPFVVNTARARIRVLGTYFNVNSYTDDAQTEVTLITGAVQVVTGKGLVRLLHNSEQAVTDGSKITVHKLTHADRILSWSDRNPSFCFDNTELNSAMQQLARWYQVKLCNPDNIKGVPLSGSLMQNNALEDNLRVIQSVEQGFVRFELRRDTLFMLKQS